MRDTVSASPHIGESEPVESLEIERKFEVPAGVRLPSAEVFAEEGLALGKTETVHLVAEYFDTPNGRLGTQHVAVRRRAGGHDEGWHLKERGAVAVRELHWPFSDDFPEGLLDELRERIGDAAETIRPIAVLRTERRVTRLSDEQGREVIELADDRVRATEIRGDGTKILRAWHEWEAELMPGVELRLLDAVARALGSVGAAASLSTSKIGRAMGMLAGSAEAKGESPEIVAALQEMDRADQHAARMLRA